MSLSAYFENTEGEGILATADADGNPDLALYACPHMVSDETLVLIMAQKRSFANLQSNPKATYMFIEKGEGYKGKRLYIHKTDEEADPDKVESLRRKKRCDADCDASTGGRAVSFAIDRVRLLVDD
jgi:hypothetical protein